MLPDRVSNPGPLTYESGALPIALRGPAKNKRTSRVKNNIKEPILYPTIQKSLAFHILNMNFLP